MAIKVFGHKSPDTDAVVSAIVYSWYLGQSGEGAKPYILGSPNKEAKYVLNRFNFDLPEVLERVDEGDRVAIVDTNNKEELIDLSQAEIISIVDHHKLAGNISTPHPIEVVIKPYGSTSTVLYKEYISKIGEVPADIAGLMLAGILSDTLEFRSPTTTEEDKKVAEKLAKIAGVDIHQLADDMFKAKSDVSDISDEDLILMDSKVFETGGMKIRISVVETTDPDQILNRKETLKQKLLEWEDADKTLLFVVDILESKAYVLITDDEVRDIIQKAFQTGGDGDVIELQGVVSRKKQIVPSLEKVLS